MLLIDTVNEDAFCPEIESEEFPTCAVLKLLEVLPEEELDVDVVEPLELDVETLVQTPSEQLLQLINS